MTTNNGVRYRVRTLPSGKQVKETISSSGRIMKVVTIVKKINRTKTGKRLNNRRRRIYR